MNKAVFLDRDGVLVPLVWREGYGYASARTINELCIWPDTIEACYKLKDAGFRLLGVTNQPDIARGLVDREVIR